MELKAALDAFLQTDCAESTRETYRKVLTRFVEDVGPGRPLDLIRPEDLDAYVLKLRARRTLYNDHPTRPPKEGRLSPATVYKRIKAIKRFFNWCVEREYLQQSPARFLKNRRPVRPLGQGKAATGEEVEAVLAAARFMPRNHAIVWLLVQSGARASEIAGLRLGNLDLEQKRAVVDGKGDKRRWIFFDDETVLALTDWLAERPAAAHDHVFTAERAPHDPISGVAISQIIRRLCRRAKVRSLGAHAFRHYVGMTLARGGTPVTVVQQYLGHASAEITLQYLRSIGERDLAAARKLLH